MTLNTEDLLEELKEKTEFLKVLGSYQKGGELPA